MQSKAILCHTVGERIPTPFDKWFIIPIFFGFTPSKVVQDFATMHIKPHYATVTMLTHLLVASRSIGIDLGGMHPQGTISWNHRRLCSVENMLSEDAEEWFWCRVVLVALAMNTHTHTRVYTVYICIYIYMHTAYVYTHVYAYIYICTHKNVYRYIYIYTSLST